MCKEDREAECGNSGCWAAKNEASTEEKDARLALEWLSDIISCIA